MAVVPCGFALWEFFRYKGRNMIVKKKINNNVAICCDSSGRELIAFGKGIGFPATPYTLTDLRKIDRTFYNVSPQYASLISEISFDIIRFTADQLAELQNELPYEYGSNLVLTLADHISFAIERAEKGLYVRMPSIHEMELDYPAEVKIARKMVAALRQTLKIKLPKNEVQGIAMHLINARDGSKSDETLDVEAFYEDILQETTRIIEEQLHIAVPQNTFNYSRFATHVRYLLKRAFEKKYTDSSNIRMYQSIREEYPTIAKCVDEVCKYYNKHWSLELSEEEKLYLIMHVNRVSSNDN